MVICSEIERCVFVCLIDNCIDNRVLLPGQRNVCIIIVLTKPVTLQLFDTLISQKEKDLRTVITSQCPISNGLTV